MRVALEKSEQEPNQSVVQRVWLAVKGGRQAEQLLAHPTASQVLVSEAPLHGRSSVPGPEVDNRASSRMSDSTWSLGCLLVLRIQPVQFWEVAWGQRVEPGKII